MSVSFSWDDSGLKKLQQKINALSGKHEVSIVELITDDFTRRHSSFQSFQALVDASGIENLEDIGNDSFSQFIASHTKFNSWSEMLKEATEEYIKRKLES